MDNATEILDWYLLAGVDETCGKQPMQILSRAPILNPTEDNVICYYQTGDINTNQTNIRPATTVLAQTNNDAYLNAKEVCRQAQTLEQLKTIVEHFEGCALKFSANSTVFGYGSDHAKLMIIGEAPGADEDRIGKPFVGRCGQLLTQMLGAIGLKREECFITNVLPWRPPGNRTPTNSEVAVCLPFLRRQIELVNPKIILLLGASAANAVLNNAESISSLRGRFIEYCVADDKVIPTLSTFHPAYLLRSPAQKSKSWSDLLRLQRKLQDI